MDRDWLRAHFTDVPNTRQRHNLDGSWSGRVRRGSVVLRVTLRAIRCRLPHARHRCWHSELGPNLQTDPHRHRVISYLVHLKSGGAFDVLAACRLPPVDVLIMPGTLNRVILDITE